MSDTSGARGAPPPDAGEADDAGRVEQARALVGERVEDRYELVRLIAVGSVGQVYEARQVALGRSVALKLVPMPKDDTKQMGLRRRFRIEAETLARLAHPNVVSIFDVGMWGEQGFIVMELLDGKTLAEDMKATRRMPLPRLLRIARQICQALDASHRVGVIHRDLKPSNVLLTRFGDQEDHVKLIDFGVAKDLSTSTDLTNQGTLIGTPRYMAPEQIMCNTDEIGPASDLYSLGAIMYRAAIGKGVFPNARGMSQLIAHVREDVPPFEAALPGHGLPAAFEAIVLGCLAKSPADRPASARALDQALAGVQAQLELRPVATPNVTPLRTPPPAPLPASLSVAPLPTGSLLAHERTVEMVLPLDELDFEDLDSVPIRGRRTGLIAAAALFGGLLGLGVVWWATRAPPPPQAAPAEAMASAAPVAPPVMQEVSPPIVAHLPATAPAAAPVAAPPAERKSPTAPPAKAADKPAPRPTARPEPRGTPRNQEVAPPRRQEPPAAPAQAPTRVEPPKPQPSSPANSDLKNPWGN